MQTREAKNAYKAEWARKKRANDPVYRAKILEYNRNRRVYKREWLKKKRESDPEYNCIALERTRKWRQENRHRIGVRSRSRKPLADRHEEMLPGHCRSCGIKLKVKSDKICETSYCIAWLEKHPKGY